MSRCQIHLGFRLGNVKWHAGRKISSANVGTGCPQVLFSSGLEKVAHGHPPPLPVLSGDPDPKVLPQLFQEHEGQDGVRDEPDTGRNKTLRVKKEKRSDRRSTQWPR